MKPKSFYLPIAYFLITFVLLVLPGNDFPKSGLLAIKGLDKIIHTIMFFLLTWLFCLPFKNANSPLPIKQRWFLTIAVAAVLYGVIMEIVQLLFVPFRSFELADIAVDTLGTVVAYVYCRKNVVEQS